MTLKKLRKGLDIQPSVWYNSPFDANLGFPPQIGWKRGGLYSSKTLWRVFHSYFVIEDNFVSPIAGLYFCQDYETLLTFCLFFLAIVYVPLVGAPVVQPDSANTRFYVACEDKRIYTIDVNQGQVVAVSDALPELGNPTGLDISRDGQTLYISSERGHWQRDYYPIVIVDVSTMRVKRKFHLKMGPPNDEWLGISAVYGLRVSPDGKTIFALYGHPKYEGVVVVDAERGTILRHLPELYFGQNQQNFIFSDDRQFAIRIHSKGIETYNLETGEKQASIPAPDLFASRGGLNPPWIRINAPLCVIHSERRINVKAGENPVRYILRTIDRMTGKVLLELDAETPVFYSDSNQAILSSGISSVVRVDLQTGRFDSPIVVGKDPTNVVSARQFIEPIRQGSPSEGGTSP